MLEAKYRVSSVATVSEARACLRTSHIDLGLADWGLPDGYGGAVAEFAEQLGVPAVIMSGHPASADDLAVHSRPHLVKPFRAAELEVTIELTLKSAVHV